MTAKEAFEEVCRLVLLAITPLGVAALEDEPRNSPAKVDRGATQLS